MSLKSGQPVTYFDSTNVRRAAICKVLNTARTENESAGGHKLAANTAPTITVVYVDDSGTTQTIANVPPQGYKSGNGNYYTEVQT